jgi:hypothetical protein
MRGARLRSIKATVVRPLRRLSLRVPAIGKCEAAQLPVTLPALWTVLPHPLSRYARALPPSSTSAATLTTSAPRSSSGSRGSAPSLLALRTVYDHFQACLEPKNGRQPSEVQRGERRNSRQPDGPPAPDNRSSMTLRNPRPPAMAPATRPLQRSRRPQVTLPTRHGGGSRPATGAGSRRRPPAPPCG